MTKLKQLYTRFFYIIFLTTNFNFFAQENLIQNGGFEEIDSCYGQPAGPGFDVFEWSNCAYWNNPAFSSSDLWCQNPTFGNQVPPYVIGTYQNPQEGENFAGMIILDVSEWNYREYIQNQLIKNLEKDFIYEIQFYVNTAGIKNQTSCLDVYFSAAKVQSNQKKLNLIPQVKNDSENYFKDTLGWVLYNEFYKAKGDEKFLTIGCFDDSSKIKVIDHDSLLANGIYLFVDEVVLFKTPYSYTIPNVFSPDNDNINDFFTPNVTNLDWKCKIFNRWGNEIVELNNSTPFWDGKNCNEGTYFYNFEGKDKEKIFNESGFIQLLK